MKIYYKCILMVFCAALSLGLALEQPARAAVSATALPMGEFLGGQALCINNSGQSAGGLIDSDDYHHACLWDFGTSVPTILDRADGHLVEFVNTDGEYINSSGHVAGMAFDEYWDCSRGFFWTEETGMVDIGVPITGDYSDVEFFVYGLNDTDQILAVVYAYDADGNWIEDDVNFVWSNGVFTALTYTDDITYDIGIEHGGINNSGQVAGKIQTSSGNRAVLWDNGITTILTTSEINLDGNIYINNTGQVAGSNNTFYQGQNPWIYTPGPGGGTRIINITGQYPGMAEGKIIVHGLNDEGQVLIYQFSPIIRAMVWEDNGSGGDKFTEIPFSSVVGPETYLYSRYVDHLNEEGQTIVYAGDPVYSRAFFWDPATPTGMAELTPLPGMTRAVTKEMNFAGLVAGYSTPSDWATFLPCIWQADGATVNYPPQLDVSAAPASEIANIEITFTATATDPDAGDTLAFSLDSDAPTGAAIDSFTGYFSWTPAAAGQYTFTVRVADSQNFYDTEEVTIDVVDPNEAPTLELPATTFSGVVGGNLTFTATATDPEGDALTFQLSGAPAGAVIDSTTGVFSWTPAAAGGYQFDVEVVDVKGAKDSEQISVSVAASPLVISVEQIACNSKWVKVLLAIENTGTDKARDVMVNAATLGDVETSSRLPIDLGAYKAGGIKNCELKFDGAAVSSGSAMLSVSGDSSLGGFAATIEVLVP